MMNITDILKTEHRLHSHMLDGLEVLLDRAETSSRVNVDLARRLLEFFALIVDGLHQDKEERALFPQLVARIGRLEVPEVERLEAHHKRDRRLLSSLRKEVEEAAFADPAHLDFFVTQARAYVGFQRRHMLEENEQLLPLVERTLTVEDDRAVRAGFRRVEHEYGTAFEPEALQLADELESNLGHFPPSSTSRRLDTTRPVGHDTGDGPRFAI